MKQTVTTIIGLAAAVCVSLAPLARAEFAEPGAGQIAAAANAPAAEMAGLLHDASSEQAANVVKAVIAKVLTLGLASDVQAARIAAVITGSFAAIPAQNHMAFAAALGTAVASSPAITTANGTVSQIQTAVAAAGGTQNGAALAQSFGTAYDTAVQQNSGSGDKKTEGDTPPVGTLYDGQNR
jgi:hypothetical protein